MEFICNIIINNFKFIMNNTIKSLFALTLLASATVQAAYVIHIPTEENLGGSLPNGSIKFVTERVEPEEPEEPEEPVVVWNVELIKKTKYFHSDQYKYQETFNNSDFNIIAGGFDHTVQNGMSYIRYQFQGYTNEQFGYEFKSFNLPTKLIAESGGISVNCTGGVGLNIPFSPPSLAMYTAGWACDGVLPNLVQMRPANMKLRFTFK